MTTSTTRCCLKMLSPIRAFFKVSEEEKNLLSHWRRRNHPENVLKEDEAAEKDECCTTYSTISQKFPKVNPKIETITDKITECIALDDGSASWL